MYRLLQLAAPLLLCASILPSAKADEQSVALKLDDGAVIHYHRTSTESQTMSVMGRNVELGRRIESDLTLRVVEHTEEGNLLIELIVGRMHGEIRKPRQPNVVFDTAAEDVQQDSEYMIRMVTALSGKPIRLTVTPAGQVVSTQGCVEALTAAVASAPGNPAPNLEKRLASITEEAAISQMQMLIPLLPGDPPSEGTTWTGTANIGVDIELLSTVDGLDEQMFSFESRGSFQRDPATGPQEPGLIKANIKSSSQVSLADGLFLSYTSTEKQLQSTKTRMGVVPIRGTRTRTLKRVAPPPKPAEEMPAKDR